MEPVKDVEKLEGILANAELSGNDYRPELLEWYKKHLISGQKFVSEYPDIHPEKTLGQGAIIYETKGSKVVRVSQAKDSVQKDPNKTAEELQKEADNAIVEALNQSRAETDLLEKLQGSPYIVKLFKTRIVKLDVCHIMEKAEFGSLNTHIPAKGMSVNRALACMQQIFSGLAFIHSQGFVHYDIKPANILVFKNGQLKLTDFEMSLRVRPSSSQYAKIVDWNGNELQKYLFAGSARYMSPEVLSQGDIPRSRTGDVLFNTDIFSAGMTFLQLLTNFLKRPPFLTTLPKKIIIDRINSNPVQEAVNIEKKLRGNACKRCKSLFRYTLQSDPSSRKSAAWIVDRMTKWTWRPGRFGFDDAKSKSIVAQMVQRRGGDARGGTRGESKVQLRL
jgi:serine/threonine protein kinase